MNLSHILSLLLLTILLNPAISARQCSKPNAPRLVTINPPTLYDPLPFGFSHIIVDTETKVAYVSGQIAVNRTLALIGTTLSEQLMETERNLKFALDAVDADVTDIMKLNVYIINYTPDTDSEQYSPTGKRLGNPASTLISVPSLAFEGLLVEIEITAAVSKDFVQKLRCEN